MTHIEAFIDDLSYRCYAYNRNRTPEISLEDWSKVFGHDVEKYETIYQKEKSK